MCPRAYPVLTPTSRRCQAAATPSAHGCPPPWSRRSRDVVPQRAQGVQDRQARPHVPRSHCRLIRQPCTQSTLLRLPRAGSHRGDACAVNLATRKSVSSWYRPEPYCVLVNRHPHRLERCTARLPVCAASGELPVAQEARAHCRSLQDPRHSHQTRPPCSPRARSGTRIATSPVATLTGWPPSVAVPGPQLIVHDHRLRGQHLPATQSLRQRLDRAVLDQGDHVGPDKRCTFRYHKA